MTRRYLGDGVYAEFDGHQVWCETLVDGRAHRIAFEPETLAALITFDREARAWKLTPEQSAAFVANLDKPPEPNTTIAEAVDRFKAMIDPDKDGSTKR